jgi:hypothetical protein
MPLDNTGSSSKSPAHRTAVSLGFFSTDNPDAKHASDSEDEDEHSDDEDGRSQSRQELTEEEIGEREHDMEGEDIICGERKEAVSDSHVEDDMEEKRHNVRSALRRGSVSIPENNDAELKEESEMGFGERSLHIVKLQKLSVVLRRILQVF